MLQCFNREMKKHVPVMLNEVLKELQKIELNQINAIDCTLGQAGHSFEIYKYLKKGVLLSIDLNQSSIEWVADEYGLMQGNQELYSKTDEDKRWFILNCNFESLQAAMNKVQMQRFDFIIADLGFSNFELNQDIGISYSEINQDLNMNYSGTGVFAKEILNNFNDNDFKKLLKDYFDDHGIKEIIRRFKNFRKNSDFKRIGDLKASLGGLPNNFLIKTVQALRSYVNQEEEKLTALCELIKRNLALTGSALIITFNPLEEKIVNKIFEEHQIIEPNIDEIIKNPQSRSAKLHIYKKTANTNKREEER